MLEVIRIGVWMGSRGGDDFKRASWGFSLYYSNSGGFTPQDGDALWAGGEVGDSQQSPSIKNEHMGLSLIIL